MSSSTVKKPVTKKKAPATRKRSRPIDEILIEVMSRFGISGTGFFVICWTFVGSATDDQKHEFIDRLILWKFPKDEAIFPRFLLICGLALYFFTIKYYRDRLRIKDEKIRNLLEDVDRLKK